MASAGGGGNEAITVVVRCRPMNQKETDEKRSNIIDIDTEARQVCIRGTKPNEEAKYFTFDATYDEKTRQKHFYEESCFSIVESALEGFNATIFAYGQTGCGKSFTMQGPSTSDEEMRGVIPNSFYHVFQFVKSTKDVEFLIRCSYLELYNEEVRDLLCAQKNAPKCELKEDPQKGVYVKGLSDVVVESPEDLVKMFDRGVLNRTTAATNMNAESSRSHSVFSIVIEMSTVDAATGKEMLRVGKLNLVDLAGSERPKKTGATDQTMKEGIKINLSLTALGNVIATLSEGGRHVPYRDSKLTRLLQDSLGGTAKTMMVAAISPADYNHEESMSTLRYANRAKNIKNKPKINEDPKDTMIREFKAEIERLKALLMQQADAASILASLGVPGGAAAVAAAPSAPAAAVVAAPTGAVSSPVAVSRSVKQRSPDKSPARASEAVASSTEDIHAAAASEEQQQQQSFMAADAGEAGDDFAGDDVHVNMHMAETGGHDANYDADDFEAVSPAKRSQAMATMRSTVTDDGYSADNFEEATATAASAAAEVAGLDEELRDEIAQRIHQLEHMLVHNHSSISEPVADPLEQRMTLPVKDATREYETPTIATSASAASHSSASAASAPSGIGAARLPSINPAKPAQMAQAPPQDSATEAAEIQAYQARRLRAQKKKEADKVKKLQQEQQQQQQQARMRGKSDGDDEDEFLDETETPVPPSSLPSTTAANQNASGADTISIKKWQKLKKKYEKKLQYVQEELEVVREDFDYQRKQLMDGLNEQTKDLRLYEEICRQALGAKELQRILDKARYDEDRDEWIVPWVKKTSLESSALQPLNNYHTNSGYQSQPSQQQLPPSQNTQLPSLQQPLSSRAQGGGNSSGAGGNNLSRFPDISASSAHAQYHSSDPNSPMGPPPAGRPPRHQFAQQQQLPAHINNNNNSNNNNSNSNGKKKQKDNGKLPRVPLLTLPGMLVSAAALVDQDDDYNNNSNNGSGYYQDEGADGVEYYYEKGPSQYTSGRDYLPQSDRSNNNNTSNNNNSYNNSSNNNSNSQTSSSWSLPGINSHQQQLLPSLNNNNANANAGGSGGNSGGKSSTGKKKKSADKLPPQLQQQQQLPSASSAQQASSSSAYMSSQEVLRDVAGSGETAGPIDDWGFALDNNHSNNSNNRGRGGGQGGASAVDDGDDEDYYYDDYEAPEESSLQQLQGGGGAGGAAGGKKKKKKKKNAGDRVQRRSRDGLVDDYEPSAGGGGGGGGGGFGGLPPITGATPRLAAPSGGGFSLPPI